MARGTKLNITDAERKRRSELARELHARRDPVTGRNVFGGSQPGQGRPRKKRATEIMNEKVEQHANEIFNRLLNILRNGKNIESLQAANQLVAIANKEADIQTKEEKNIENTSTEELMELVATRIARLSERGVIDFDFEGQAEDVEAPAIAAGNEGTGDEDVDEREDEPPGHSEASGSDERPGTSPFTRRSSNG